MGGSGNRVAGNSVSALTDYRSFIRVTEDAYEPTVSSNDVYGTNKGGAGIELDGSADGMGPTPVTLATIQTNTVDVNKTAIWLQRVANSTVIANEIDAGTGLSYLDDVASVSVYWNNVTTTGKGVQAGSSGDPIEVSDGVSRGNWWSHSCPGALFTGGTDSSRSNVVDSYPYAFSEAWEAHAAPGCDSTAPSAPTVDFPLDEAMVLDKMLAFAGRTEAYAEVIVTEGVNEVARGIANSTGDFYLEAPGLAVDDYEFVFTATDPHGNISSSTELDATVIVVDENNTLANGDSSVIIVGMDDAPDRFVPTDDEVNEMTLVLDIEEPSEIEDGSYVVFTERNFLDPVNREEVAVVYGVTEFDPESGVDRYIEVTVEDAWDGRDDTGTLLAEDLAYPYEVTSRIGRVPDTYGCEMNETLMELDEDMAQAFESAVLNPPGWWTSSPICCVLGSPQDHASDFTNQIVDYSTYNEKPWEKEGDRARDCTEAFEQCKCTERENWTGSLHGESLCRTCFRQCDGQGEWPDNEPAIGQCDYWGSLYEDSKNRPKVPIFNNNDDP